MTVMQSERKSNLAGYQRFLHFSLGEEDFAFPLGHVKEVIGVPTFTHIPHGRKHALGIFNLRGQIISAIDLCVKLDITSQPIEPALVICDLESGLLAVKVDSVNAVFSPKKELLSDCPPTETSFPQELIMGVYRNEAKLILILDVARTLDSSDLKMIEQTQQPLSAA